MICNSSRWLARLSKMARPDMMGTGNTITDKACGFTMNKPNYCLIFLLLLVVPACLRAVPSSREVDRDGRFVAYDNSTVVDTKTGLMWAAADNGQDISWAEAKTYCETFRGGGYDDWRMPTVDELEGLYDEKNPGYREECYEEPDARSVRITRLIRISCCCPLAYDTRDHQAAIFHFVNGHRGWLGQSGSNFRRALPVRNFR